MTVPESDLTRWEGIADGPWNGVVKVGHWEICEAVRRFRVADTERREQAAEIEELRKSIGSAIEIGVCDDCGREDALIVWLSENESAECIQCNSRTRESLAAALADAGEQRQRAEAVRALHAPADPDGRWMTLAEDGSIEWSTGPLCVECSRVGKSVTSRPGDSGAQRWPCPTAVAAGPSPIPADRTETHLAPIPADNEGSRNG